MPSPTTTIRLPGDLRERLTEAVETTGLKQGTLITFLLDRGLRALEGLDDDIASRIADSVGDAPSEEPATL